VRSLRWALVGLGALGALLAGLGVLVVASSNHVTGPEATVSAAVVVVVMASYLGTGLFAWWRRPENRTGALMCLVGFLFWLNTLLAANSEAVFTAGVVLSSLFLVAAVHLVVAYPTGRLAGQAERAVIGGAYVLTLVAQVAVLLVMEDLGMGEPVPANALLVADVPWLATAIQIAATAIALPLVALLAVLLARRWRRASRPARRALGGLSAVGLLMIVLLGVVLAAQAVIGPDASPDLVAAPLLVAFAALPWAFVVGLLRSRWARAGAVSALVERLGGARRHLRDDLAEALGDPSLDLVYWLPREGRWVDARGHPSALPAGDDPARAATIVEHGGERVGALVHDRALCEAPELVGGVAAAAGLAMANERLQAELHARLEELRESRARLIEAGLAERRRLERDLHDGAQQRLVALSLQVGLAQRELERGADPQAAAALLHRARDELRLALEELRELARGIHPAVLTDRGLEAAIATLAARFPLPIEVVATPPVRLPGAVEVAAYFVVSEALANMAKHAGASRATVRVAREGADAVVEVRDDGRGGASPTTGTGLQGLADRVAGLDGRLDVLSPPGGGTLVRARIPCASS
jgi:signal transduction histidine kinase